jgi:hypothetical protein
VPANYHATPNNGPEFGRGLAQTFTIGGRHCRKRRAARTLLPKRQIHPQHVETRRAKSLCNRNQDLRLTVRPGAVRQNDTIYSSSPRSRLR